MKFLKSYPSRLILIQLRGKNPNGFFDIVLPKLWYRQLGKTMVMDNFLLTGGLSHCRRSLLNHVSAWRLR